MVRTRPVIAQTVTYMKFNYADSEAFSSNLKNLPNAIAYQLIQQLAPNNQPLQLTKFHSLS